MPSTYTNNSGIEKPGSGEQAGTWGATSNNNFDIIDRALNGVGVITLAGTSHTLTTTDGTLSDGQYKVLILAGTPSGTNTVTISPNDQDKIYFVRNTTAQSVVFTQGSGGNATVPSGETKIIYADGAGAGAAVSDFTGALSITGNVNATTLDINGTQVTATAAELNTLDGITATTAELNYTDGVTSNIQTQLNTLSSGKEATITGAATTITSSNLTANRALLSDGSGKVAASANITSTELGYLDGVTSNIQTQLNTLSGGKEATITGAATTITSSNLTANRALLSDGSGKVAASANITSTELGYLDGVTSNIQTQINGISTSLISDPTPTLGGQLNTNGNSIKFGNWTIVLSGTDLLFQYSGDTKIRMTAAGALDVEDDITAYSGI